ncbi:MAG: ligase-associated DNA damage response endonuclease PdeM [Alphaproteobacteria bacterium]|nr:ligase-associated DNA damage response endonuclease PdeM [Alphaproteobacteria bacterium]
MNGTPIHIAGTRLIADPAGAVYAPEHRVLMVADLHLEKGSAYAAAGAMLPPYDSRHTLMSLERLCRHYAPDTVYCLGDSFHDDEGAERLGSVERARLCHLGSRHKLIWIAGNHDAHATPPCGETVDEAVVGRLVLRHEARREAMPAGEISGHFHPKASVRLRGRHISGRCFVADANRLLLPAFGAFAGGLDATDPAIASLFGPRFKVFMMSRQRLVAIARAQLLPPRAGLAGADRPPAIG